jgi:hypothetical protein
LNSGLLTCRAGCLPVEPHLQSGICFNKGEAISYSLFCLLIIQEEGNGNFHTHNFCYRPKSLFVSLLDEEGHVFFILNTVRKENPIRPKPDSQGRLPEREGTSSRS